MTIKGRVQDLPSRRAEQKMIDDLLRSARAQVKDYATDVLPQTTMYKDDDEDNDNDRMTPGERLDEWLDNARYTFGRLTSRLPLFARRAICRTMTHRGAGSKLVSRKPGHDERICERCEEVLERWEFVISGNQLGHWECIWRKPSGW